MDRNDLPIYKSGEVPMNSTEWIEVDKDGTLWHMKALGSKSFCSMGMKEKRDMPIEEYRKLILNLIGTGTKAVELATNLAMELAKMEVRCSYDIWEDGLTPLIESGDIVEVEYILPDVDYRVKSFLLPKGTKVLNNVSA